MKRLSTVRPGYDCIHGNCPAKNCAKTGTHGICAERWVFSVVGDGVALAISISTPFFPPTVDEWRRRGAKFSGASMTLHVGWPVNEGDRRGKGEPSECDLLPGGKCWDGGSWGLKAEDFWKQHGQESFGQREEFWTALERELVSLSEDALQFRDHRVCPYCKGDGSGRFAFPTGGAR